jgi:hypothetical protein
LKDVEEISERSLQKIQTIIEEVRIEKDKKFSNSEMKGFSSNSSSLPSVLRRTTSSGVQKEAVDSLVEELLDNKKKQQLSVSDISDHFLVQCERKLFLSLNRQKYSPSVKQKKNARQEAGDVYEHQLVMHFLKEKVKRSKTGFKGDNSVVLTVFSPG